MSIKSVTQADVDDATARAVARIEKRTEGGGRLDWAGDFSWGDVDSWPRSKGSQKYLMFTVFFRLDAGEADTLWCREECFVSDEVVDGYGPLGLQMGWTRFLGRWGNNYEVRASVAPAGYPASIPKTQGGE
jgi:hypothetical protein